MYVRQLDLENIRSFEKATIELHPNINLLVGNNNSGKSTIIKALFALQNRHSLEFDDVRKGKEEGKVSMNLAEISGSDADLFAVNDNEKNAKPVGNTVNIILALSKRLGSEKSHREMFYIEKRGEEENMPESPNISDFYLFPEDESKRNYIYPFFAKRKVNGYSRQLGGRENAFRISPDLSNLVTKIQHISNPSHPQSKKFMDTVRDILGFDIGIVPYHNSDNTPGIFVDGSLTIEAERMGEGVVNILGMIVLLLTQDDKLYLIEEPENDIHPKALKKLLNLIIEKSDSNQFVISTHSNIVVKYLGDPDKSKIFGLKWQPTNKFHQNIPTSQIECIGDSPEAKLSLLSDLGYDLLDFDLYSSYIIFEESSAERIVRDFLIPWFVPALHNKVRTIAALGVADLQTRVIDFARLFIFIHQTPVYRNKAWVFADGDNAGKKCITELRQKFKEDWKPDQFQNFTARNFEEYYPVPFSKKYETIKEIKNSDEKRAAKRNLLNELLDWAQTEPEKAKIKFKKSFSEVIGGLEKIAG
ncbi:MAG: AAA family ATPase, partial [Sediminibacterium sp.]